MKTICIIPARGGSVRIPKKNIKLFHGKPMLQRAIETAQASRLFDRIVVSTDDNEIAGVAHKHGAVVFRRPKDDGTKGTQEVARDVLQEKPFSDAAIVCVLYPCTPLLTFRDLLGGYQALLDREPDAAFSMSSTADLADAGGFYFGWAAHFHARTPLARPHVVCVPMAEHFDINTPEDWARAEEKFALATLAAPLTATEVLARQPHVAPEHAKAARVALGAETTADFWSGDFGDEYTDRNKVPWSERVPFWRRMLERTNAKSFLDVGCNAGWNMQALRRINTDLSMTGVDINEHALDIAKAAGLDVQTCAAADVAEAFGPNACDMVITSGVLIHVAPADLETTMKAIRDASNRWVMAIEYEAAQETEVDYRGHAGKLWKRPFGEMYQKLGLALVETGKADGYDDCSFWLLEKAGT